MHRTVFPAIAIAIAILGLTAAACGDSSGGDDDIDAMEQADAADNVDAAGQPDAPGTPDASPPDALPPGMVTITINDTEGTGIEGIDVVFSDPAGNLVSTTQTDASGEASEILGGDSLISILTTQAGDPAQFVVYTIGDVQPGDSIVVSDFDAVPDPGQGNVDVAAITWPGTFTDATSYLATEGCNQAETADPGTPSDLAIDGDCVHPTDQFHVIAQAVQAGQFTDTVLAAAVALDSDVGNDVTLPAWSDQFTALPVTISNPPAGILLYVGGAGFQVDNAFVDILDDAILFGGDSYDGLLPEGLTPDATQLVTGWAFGAGMTITGFGQYTENVAGTPSGTTTHDLAMATRSATNGSFSTADVARPSIDWQASATPNVAKLTQAFLTWTDDDGAEEHTWILVTAPRENGPIGFPEMPAALDAYAATGTSSYDAAQVVYFYGDWITEDWPTLRQQGGVSANPQPAIGWIQALSAPNISLGPAIAPTHPAAVLLDRLERLVLPTRLR